MKTKNYYLLSLLALLLAGCAGGQNPTTQASSTTSIPPSSTSEIKPKSPRFKENFNFNYFKSGGYEDVHEITEGLTHYEHTMIKTNNDVTVFHTLEIDLDKVSIAAGTKDNKSYDHTFPNNLEVPHKMATAYTRDTGKKVYASINADFFNPDGAVGKCVNAFVKDGFIVKSAHNDNYGYDYRVDSHDVPASYPMLFGVSNDVAQVAPIFADNDLNPLDAKNKKDYVKTNLIYRVSNGVQSFDLIGKSKFSVSPTSVRLNDLYYVIDISHGPKDMSVLDIKAATQKGTLPALEEGQAYLVFAFDDQAANTFANKITKSSKLSLEVTTSVDDIWLGADTILGCRHNLIKDNEVADTLQYEYSNGATNPIVPKSAVGVRADGTVVVFAVEGLKYGHKGTDDDPIGVSLPELAEFMSYNNILNGANFDGGGSVQLIVKDPGHGDKVYVRSSDTASYELDSTRKVANALLVVEK